MIGSELRPGLHRWTASHEEWGSDVASVAISDEQGVVLIDPLLVGDQWDELAEAVDGRRLDVVITIHYHARSTPEVLARFPEARAWAHSRDRAATARRTPVTDTFTLGPGLPGGLVAMAALPRTEVVLWAPSAAALICGDVLLGDGELGDGLHTCPESWLPGKGRLPELRAALAPVLELPVELVLPSHGEPVLEGGKAALADAIG